MNKIGLAMIVRGTDEEIARAKVAVDSVKEYVDAVYVTLTYEGEMPKMNTPEGWNVSYFKWVDDFSKARTYNFSKVKEPWILWLDADDTLQGADKLKNYVDMAESKHVDGMLFLYKYGFDETGNCIDEHWKAQLLKNNGHFEWQGRIHEDALQVRAARWIKVPDIVRIHHTDHDRGQASSDRNLRILLKEREEKPNDPRPLFYLGRAYIQQGDFENALLALDEYLKISGWDEERYEAALLIGQCYLQMKDWDQALQVYNKAILEKEEYPDAYLQKAITYMQKDEYRSALYNLKAAQQMKVPEGHTYVNPMNYTRNLFQAAAVCYLKLGKIDEALAAVDKALSYDPKNADNLELQRILRALRKKYDAAEAYVTIAKYYGEGNKEKVQRLLSTVPADLMDNVLIMGLRNTFMPPKEWPKNSIAIFCAHTAEPWTPDSLLSGGIGGSETAVIQLSRRLVKKGWDVTVFNRCDAPPEGLEFEGVKYQNYWTFNAADQFDVLWAWRTPELFDLPIRARFKGCDMHDVMSPGEFPPKRVASIDKIFVKTQYHRTLYPDVADNKFVIVGNGIDLDRFDEVVPKEPSRAIYSSSPNRGLDLILRMWPKIKEKVPKAELHVFYGWNTFYEVEKHNPERMLWMRNVRRMMDQEGIVDHGRVDQQTLAQEMLKSTFWLYPTYFPEIHCITACEVQAAGVVPVTSGFAALEEVQQSGIKLPGDVYDPRWQEEYIQKFADLANNPKEVEVQATRAREAAKNFSWDLVADVWDKELKHADN